MTFVAGFSSSAWAQAARRQHRLSHSASERLEQFHRCGTRSDRPSRGFPTTGAPSDRSSSLGWNENHPAQSCIGHNPVKLLYTSRMDAVRFGRALGFGARQAVKTVTSAVSAATAENPSAKEISHRGEYGCGGCEAYRTLGGGLNQDGVPNNVRQGSPSSSADCRPGARSEQEAAARRPELWRDGMEDIHAPWGRALAGGLRGLLRAVRSVRAGGCVASARGVASERGRTLATGGCGGDAGVLRLLLREQFSACAAAGTAALERKRAIPDGCA